MYRIRRESGEEVTFGSIDELGAAVVSGVVTAKAEIFHARAEKWLPIASHPHFKMAHDRINAASAPRAAARAHGLAASGQRPALGASGQRPSVTAPQSSSPTAPSAAAPRVTAPQLRVMRPEAASAAPAAATDSPVTQKPARWNSAQRAAARAVAPAPAAPSAPPASDLRLVLADALLSGAATAPALPEVEFELLPVLEEPAVIETVVERSPAAVELVSHDEQPAAVRGEVEIINPDRTMPVVSHHAVPSLEIPEPIRDFAPLDAAAEPVAASRSKTPLFVGIGLAAAAAAVIGFFVMKPASPATAEPTRDPAPAQAAAALVAEPSAPSPPVVTTAPKGASTGLGGDVPTRKPKPSDAQTASGGSIGDGLEPPPVVLPAAPGLGKIGDAAALPTIDAGSARNDAMARAQALEKTRREIDSSMRSEAATR